MKDLHRRQTVSGLHHFLYGFNGVVIFLIAGFMDITQKKIVQSMAARSFVEPLSSVPWPSQQILLGAVCAFGCLFGLSYVYREGKIRNFTVKYSLIVFEIIFCVLVMRSINMAYDGVVLLVVADLVQGYEGKNQKILLVMAMLALYIIANYNLAALQMKIVPIEAYFSYYTPMVQGVLKAVCNIFTSLNLVIFVLYMTMLVQSQQREKERIKSLNAQLNAANAQLRTYAFEVERMAETRERNRLAREIHDTLGHALTGIAAGIDACIATLDAAPDFTREQLKKIRETAKNGITDVRRSVKKLRPDVLEKLSLPDALHQMSREFDASTGMRIVWIKEIWPPSLREDEEVVVYRIIQEGLTNANRHGHAAKVEISVSLQDEGLEIILQDNGIGCTDISPGFGLRHMQERIALLKGQLFYANQEGFQIKAVIPIGGQHYDKSGYRR
jgi:signal transduction histidine kinase